MPQSNLMPAQTAARTALYDCAKCDGRGTIGAFGHIHCGRCFDCKGSGKVELRRITAGEALQITINNIGYSVNGALEALQDGNTERAHYLLERHMRELFTIGTDNARVILADIAKGEWFCGGTMTRGQAPAAAAAGLCRWVIARGREVEAAAHANAA